MIVEPTSLPGVKCISPKVFGDHRGFFFEAFNAKKFREQVANVEFVQDNHSLSARGVLRGMHYQLPPFAQAKLVFVIQGEVLDVAVDVRKSSPHFGKSATAILTGENKKQLFIPHGFAHGFVVLSETALFAYKVDNYYAPGSEAGFRYNDPSVGIPWQLKQDKLVLSDKDKHLPMLHEATVFD